jgi:aflatoxin B1 aldehyde reductase
LLTRSQNIIGKVYSDTYGKPTVEDTVVAVRQAAEKYNVTGHAAALRWTAFHSILDGKYGDAVIFGARNMEQLEQSLDAFEAGKLPTELADAIAAVYKAVEGEDEPPFHL